MSNEPLHDASLAPAAADTFIDPEMLSTGRVTGKGRLDAPELKTWVLVRMDTGMSLGKMIAQTGHAFVTAFAISAYHNPERAYSWFNAGQPKLSKKAKNENELLKCFNACRDAGLVAVIVEDEGRTEFDGVRTLTGVCVGPCLFEELPKAVQRLQNISVPLDFSKEEAAARKTVRQIEPNQRVRVYARMFDPVPWFIRLLTFWKKPVPFVEEGELLSISSSGNIELKLGPDRTTRYNLEGLTVEFLGVTEER